MATPINAPLAGEIWHLSIEDLFQPVQEAPRLGGDGPFVINLSVSTAPISVPAKAFASYADAHVYQIQVTEDGRARFRLRLGPFASEDAADAILAEVRETYPGALTATASGSDLRVIAGLQAKVEQRQSAAKKTVEKAAVKKAPVEKAADEVVIDIAWPTPELVVPPKAPLRTAPPVAPPVIAKVAMAPVAPATRPPAAAAPASVPAPAPASAPAPAPVIAAAPQWALPELDIPLPVAAARATAPPAPRIETVPPASVLSASNFTAPLAIVNDAPLLTEVVVPVKKFAPKNKPSAAALAPILTDAVMPKIKTPVAPAAAAKRVMPPPMVSAPAPIAAMSVAVAAATPKAPPVVASAAAPPAIVAIAVVAPAIVAPIVIPATPIVTVTAASAIAPPPPVAPPVATVPVAAVATPAPVSPSISAAAPAPAPKMPAPKAPAAAPKAAAPVPKAPAPKAPAPKAAAPVPKMPVAAPVLTQSVAPRSAAGYKARGGIAKPLAPNKLTSLQHVVVATAPLPAPREVKELEEPLESLESTQTIRALTPKELEDNDARWFVIQLSLADHAFDPDSVPNLDIFSEYRLYSVAGLDQGRVVHALRLGFFREEIGAVAVASYLAAFWEQPTIKRVSVAERERFADQRVEARKDIGATGRHAVIEITDELVARRRKSSKAAAAHTPPQRPIEH
jgi:hypothetical protein